MKSFFQSIPACFIASLVLVSTGSAWQEEIQDETIEIVDQDGQQVSPQKFKVVTKQLEKKPGDDSPAVKSIDIESKDGKIIIVDSDGTRREIDVSGAQNIIVNKSVQSIMKDGEQQQQVNGMVIITGPDGEKQEIILGDGEAADLGVFVPEMGDIQGVFEMIPEIEGRLDFGPRNFVFGKRRGAAIGKFMVGVNCKPVSDQLRAHLDLAEGAGLVVATEVGAETPAGQAGVKIHDVLIYADQQDLESVKDLVDAVQLAGKEEREMTITLLRGGKEISVEVKPVEREKVTKIFGGMPGNVGFEFEKIGPGVVFQDERLGGIDPVERIEERMKAMMEELRELKKGKKEN